MVLDYVVEVAEFAYNHPGVASGFAALGGAAALAYGQTGRMIEEQIAALKN